MNTLQKRAAVAYARQEYCNDDIETDCTETSNDLNFSEGIDGVWLRAWLFVPKEEIPGYDDAE